MRHGAGEFELVINLKTAKRIEVTVPPHVLLQADKVIKRKKVALLYPSFLRTWESGFLESP